MPADPAAYELAYEEAKRALDDEQRSLVELRSRASTLIAAATITTSFLGGQALARDGLDPAGWIAIGCFVGLGLAVLAVLWPHRDWVIAIEPARFVATYVERHDGRAVPVPVIHRNLALHIGDGARLNRQRLGRLTLGLRAGAVLLMAEVLSWVVVLAERS